MEQKFVWIEIEYDPDKIDISSWVKDGKLDASAMQKSIKEELIRGAKETEKWQKRAIKFSVPVR
jgi:hypothetical protein